MDADNALHVAIYKQQTIYKDMITGLNCRWTQRGRVWDVLVCWIWWGLL